MAFFQGYVGLRTDNYTTWKNEVAGNGYDADLHYGDQCWDLISEFYYNIGFPFGYPHTGPNGYAYECWTVSRDANTSYNGVQYFDLIYNIGDVKRGDIVVYAGTSQYPAGHIAFADQDYPGFGQLAILGQNQGSGGTPPAVVNPDGGTTANVNTFSVSDFIGAFRYKQWHVVPVHVKTTFPKTTFPWVIYTRKLRNKSR